MRKRSSINQRVKDTDQLVTEVVSLVISDIETNIKPLPKNPAAVALGRLGGLKGGKARANKLSAVQRSEIARHAASIRWNKETKNDF